MYSAIFRIKSKTAAVIFALLFFCGCGTDGGDTPARSASISLVSAAAGTVRVRWFPGDNDTEYSVKLRSIKSGDEDQFTVYPRGCTSKAIAGFTSGICVLDFQTADPFNMALQIRAGTADGRGEKGASAFIRVNRLY